MTARTHLQVRVADAKVDEINTMAKEHHLSRSDVLRACLAVAFQHRNELVSGLQLISKMKWES